MAKVLSENNVKTLVDDIKQRFVQKSDFNTLWYYNEGQTFDTVESSDNYWRREINSPTTFDIVAFGGGSDRYTDKGDVRSITLRGSTNRVITIPTAVRNLPYYGLSCGDYQNRVERRGDKWFYVQEVKSVGFADLPWRLQRARADDLYNGSVSDPSIFADFDVLVTSSDISDIKPATIGSPSYVLEADTEETWYSEGGYPTVPSARQIEIPDCSIMQIGKRILIRDANSFKSIEWIFMGMNTIPTIVEQDYSGRYVNNYDDQFIQNPINGGVWTQRLERTQKIIYVLNNPVETDITAMMEGVNLLGITVSEPITVDVNFEGYPDIPSILGKSFPPVFTTFRSVTKTDIFGEIAKKQDIIEFEQYTDDEVETMFED